MELSDRICEMCFPRIRCTLQHSSQRSTPLLMEAHDGSIDTQILSTQYIISHRVYSQLIKISGGAGAVN